MLHPYRRIGTTELHEGAIFFDIVRFTDCHRAIYMSTWEKNNTHKIGMRGKTHVLLYLFAKDIRHARAKQSPRPTFRSEC